MPDGNGGGIIKIMVDAGLGYLWFIFLAIWGGTVNYINRVRRSKSPFSLIELFGEWTVSGFSGLITAYFCAEMGMTFYMTAAMAGIAGHMGGRAIFIMEKWMQVKLGWKPEQDNTAPTSSKDEEYPSKRSKDQ
jgi:hypothetical protein